MGPTKVRMVAMCDCGYLFPRLGISKKMCPDEDVMSLNPSRCPACENIITEIIEYEEDEDEFYAESAVPQKERR